MTTAESGSYVDSTPTIPGEVLSAPVVAALEHAWHAIRARHPEVPAVVVVLAAGSIGAPRGSLRLGHFAAMRWDHDTTISNGAELDEAGESETRREALPEVFVGGEGLALGPVDVLGTLLHEAAHALAHARGIRDTSRQGRYHNRRYAALAEELGLSVAETGTIGWSETRVPEATVIQYAEVIESLRVALTIQRRAEHALTTTPAGPDQPGAAGDADEDEDQTQGGRKRNGNPTPCVCGCGRRIRVAPTVLDQGAITCSLCGQDFTPAARS